MYAERFKNLRKTLRYKIDEIADILEIPARTIGSYERGERVPSAEFVTKLVEKLNVNANWFVSGKGNMFNDNSQQDEQLKKLVAQIVDEKMKERGL